MKKKIILLLLFFCFICTNAFANQILRINKKEEQISTGTIYKEFEILTSEGWIKAKMLELDAKDENDKLTVLSSEEGTKKLASVTAMAKVKNAIGGINGDFFAGKSGIGNSIGLAIDNGEIISSSAEDNKNNDIFASFLMNEKGNFFYEYVKDDITILCGKNETEIKARYINKYTDNANIPTIYTSAWGEKAIGSTESLNVTEFVVKNGKVSEIFVNEEAADIPKNGFVIMIATDAANELRSLLKVKTPVSYKTNYEPNISNIDFAISGGAKLIENGIVPESFSHTTGINGKNPRTVLGTNKNSSKIFLITIDGRTKDSLGMSLEETAEFLKELDIYTAINLDGGGSTTMVVKKAGEFETTLVNTPSGGTQRLVANGVGIVNTSESTEKLSELKIIIDDTNIFVGEKRKVSVVGYDKNYNPIEIEIDDIKWDYDGVELYVKDGYVFGETIGSAQLIAKYGKIKTSCEINILSNVNEAYVYPKETSINPGESVNYHIKAKNKNGYYATIENDFLTAKIYKYYNDDVETSIPKDATIENNTFSATTPGIYLISFSKDNFTTYAKVNVTKENFVVLDDFEEESFYFDPYPDEVGGSAKISSELKFSGNYSAKLEYDFDKATKVRGAYIVLNESIKVPENATSLSFMLYNTGEKEEDIKVKFKDANDKNNMVVIEDSIMHEGWKEIRLDLSAYARPIYVSDIYLAQNEENIRNKGYVYVDRFGYYTKGSGTINETVSIPKDIKIEDENNISVDNEKAFNIAFITPFTKPLYMLDGLKVKRFIDNVNEKDDFLVLINEDNVNFKNDFIQNVSNSDYGLLDVQNIKKDYLENQGYDLFYNDKVTIITMDTSKFGIRKSDEEQYFNIENDIRDDETGNVIIVLNGSLDNFEDEKERKLFVDLLCDIKRETKKNIFVVQEGYNQDYQMERGVKFLNIKDTNTSFENEKDSKYLSISVNGKEISYEYKSMF